MEENFNHLNDKEWRKQDRIWNNWTQHRRVQSWGICNRRNPK